MKSKLKPQYFKNPYPQKTRLEYTTPAFWVVYFESQPMGHSFPFNLTHRNEGACSPVAEERLLPYQSQGEPTCTSLTPASSRAWQWWCVSWGLTNFSRDWLQVARKRTQGLVAKEAVSLSPLVDWTLYRGGSPSLQDDCHISQSTLHAREVGGGEVGWSGKCGGHLFVGKGRSGKGGHASELAERPSPRLLASRSLSYPAMPLFIQQRVTDLLMCIRLRTCELGIGAPTLQRQMDANPLLTGMNASLSTEKSAPKRTWLCESVYPRKLTWTGEGLPEEVTAELELRNERNWTVWAEGHGLLDRGQRVQRPVSAGLL